MSITVGNHFLRDLWNSVLRSGITLHRFSRCRLGLGRTSLLLALSLAVATPVSAADQVQTAAKAAQPAAAQEAPPHALDNRLKVELVAEHPHVVTPTGIDVDDRNRVFVIESNTHFRPNEYPGHPSDRLLMFQPGSQLPAPAPIVVADGFTHAMSVLVAPAWIRASTQPQIAAPAQSQSNKPISDPATFDIDRLPSQAPLWLYVATRREIFLLQDANDDGQADKRESIIRLETPGNYPHNGLAGLALDPTGWLYFGFGENLGADYKLIGSDGRTLSGGNEGGNVYRCRLDGRHVEQVATGFWNPHASCFDALGRLFTVDNDPDSRPPCRLLQIVPGGDYGYRFRNGRKGLHPFTAWDGELPGTLPMVSGTGEAPSGMVFYEHDRWPAEYRGNLLVGTWGDHRIDRFRLQPKGSSFVAKPEPLIVGGGDFRPVGLAVGPDGALYFSDWVKRDYNLHRHGRVWRVVCSEQPTSATSAPSTDLVQGLKDPVLPRRRLAASKAASTATSRTALLQLLTSPKAEQQPRLEAFWALARFALQTAAPEGDLRSSLPAAGEPGRPDALTTAAVRVRLDLPGLGAAGSRVEPLTQLLYRPVYPPRASHDPTAAALLPLGDPPLKISRLTPGLLAECRRDPFVFHAVLQQLVSAPGTIKLAELWTLTGEYPAAEQETAQLLVVLAARQRHPSETPLLTELLQSPSARVRAAAVQWIGEEKLSAQRPVVEQMLASDNMTADLFFSCLATLELLDGKPASEFERSQGNQYASPLIANSRLPDRVRALALRIIPPGDARLKVPQLVEWIQAGQVELQQEAVRKLVLIPTREAHLALRELVQNDKLSIPVRAELIAGLGRTAVAAGTAAAPTQALDSDVRSLLLTFVKGEQPQLQREAVRSLRGEPLNQPVMAEARTVLLKTLQTEATQLDELANQLAIGFADSLTSETDPLAKAVRVRQQPLPVNPEELLALIAAKPSVPADPVSGRIVFYHQRSAGCSVCHTVQGQGGRLGPDLTTIARSRSREQLLEAIAAPSRDVAPQYATCAIETVDGKTFAGMITRDDVQKVDLAQPDGKVISLPTAEIAERVVRPESLMPEKLVTKLTKQELLDLLAYLESLR